MSARITVLLVDDHALVRRGFRRLIEDDESLEVVGEASTAEEAIAMAAATTPRVIVMDCAMPGGSGLTATKDIVERLPRTAVLMLSMHAEDTLVQQALAAGARGYVLKNAVDLDLAGAVKRVAAGETLLDPRLAGSERLQGERGRALTPREREVLQLICDGMSNRDIASRLILSVNTVAVHRANIMTTLGVHKTAELVVYALENGLVNRL
jgi:DNA-binding NarL/FixJ family response regulator